MTIPTAGSYPCLWFLPPETPATAEHIAQGLPGIPGLYHWLEVDLPAATGLPDISWQVLDALAQSLNARQGTWANTEYWDIWGSLMRWPGSLEDALLDLAFKVHGSVGQAATSCSFWRSGATLWLKLTAGSGSGRLARYLAKAIQATRHAVSAASVLNVANDIPVDVLLDIAPFLAIDIGVGFLTRPEASVAVWNAWAESRWGSKAGGGMPLTLARRVAIRSDLRQVPVLRAITLGQSTALFHDLRRFTHLYRSGEAQAFWLEVCARCANKTYIPEDSPNDKAEEEFQVEAQAALASAMATPATTETLVWLSQSDSADVRKWVQLAYMPCMVSA